MLEVQEIRDHKFFLKKGGSIPRQCNSSEPRVLAVYIIDLL